MKFSIAELRRTSLKQKKLQTLIRTVLTFQLILFQKVEDMNLKCSNEILLNFNFNFTATHNLGSN
jgi:hypothetical protein